MFCRFCGKEINNDSKFCLYCGKNLTNEEVNETTNDINTTIEPAQQVNDTSPNTEEKSSNPWGTLFIIVIIFFVFIFIMASAVNACNSYSTSNGASNGASNGTSNGAVNTSIVSCSSGTNTPIFSRDLTSSDYTYTTSQDLTTFSITITPKTNIKSCDVELILYNSNGTTIFRDTISKTNLKKGSSYMYKFDFGFVNSLSGSSVKFFITGKV